MICVDPLQIKKTGGGRSLQSISFFNKASSHLKLLVGEDDVESSLVKMPLKETNKNSSHV